MPAKELPDPEYLRQRLRYEPETGKLYWRECPSMPRCWNARYAGREAQGVHSDGYVRVSVDGVRYLAHRLVWCMNYGCPPEDQIDHINGVRTDNRLENLRAVSNTDNSRNASLSKRNTSGIAGVCWDKRRKRWSSRIMVDKREVFLGYFESREEGAAAREKALKAYNFHPNHGRAPPVIESVAPATDKRPALDVQSVADDFRDLLPTEN